MASASRALSEMGAYVEELEAEVERLRLERDGLVERIAMRIQHCSDVIDSDEVSRTARTLHRTAALVRLEFGSSLTSSPSTPTAPTETP